MNYTNYTNIEQSRKLLELGLRPESADMYYKQKIGERTDLPYYEVVVGHSFAAEQNLFSFRNGLEIPCWSVGALLELLNYPKLYEDRLGDEDVWFCESFIEEWSEYYQGDAMKTQIDAVYILICWLLQNEYIKTK